ncbi:MAG: HAMP domain-containing sensor histidine kinase [Acidobacteriota bacterium]
MSRSSWVSALVVFALAATAAVLLLGFQQQLSSSWLTFGTHPQVLEQLDDSLEDLKTLGRLDPEQRALYRQRFEQTQQLRNRLEILSRSRQDLVRRYQQILGALFLAAAVVVAAAAVARHRLQAARLARLRSALEALAVGRTELEPVAVGGGTLGRIATMIESTSKVMARDRRRLAALDNLSSWQEAARRHAHEMRTPLTGASLELGRVISSLETSREPPGETALAAARSAEQELQRLGQFTRAFTSFARLPEPRRVLVDLGALVEEFVTTFGEAWPLLSLELRRPSSAAEGPWAKVDREMLRQVFVNLCDNSARAMEDMRREAGRVVISFSSVGEGGLEKVVGILVEDDGPGVAQELAPRLFEPYVSSRQVGEGMGLGLAICRKILLDHGGDLELLSARGELGGALFRLTLPREDSPASAAEASSRGGASSARKAALVASGPGEPR